jgi:BirA family transcriptional regulator, biotin operon repressor / biotin---[acetyl-CoA-carboxylase] ligase
LKLASGHRVIRHRSIDSTNAEARRLSEAGETGPLWVVAEEQTAGRGRLGRRWVSAPGNFYGTLVLPLGAAPAVMSQLGFVAALAVRDAASELCADARFELKWPNDVLMDGAKVSGLLSEILVHDPAVIAVGCGINLAHAPEGLAYPVAKLGAHVTPDDMLQRLDRRLAHRLAAWDGGRGFAETRAAWLQWAQGQGEKVAINGLEGVFEGLADDGGLRLRMDDGSRRIVHAGDVRMGTMA